MTMSDWNLTFYWFIQALFLLTKTAILTMFSCPIIWFELCFVCFIVLCYRSIYLAGTLIFEQHFCLVYDMLTTWENDHIVFDEICVKVNFRGVVSFFYGYNTLIDIFSESNFVTFTEIAISFSPLSHAPSGPLLCYCIRSQETHPLSSI